MDVRERGLASVGTRRAEKLHTLIPGRPYPPIGHCKTPERERLPASSRLVGAIKSAEGIPALCY